VHRALTRPPDSSVCGLLLHTETCLRRSAFIGAYALLGLACATTAPAPKPPQAEGERAQPVAPGPLRLAEPEWLPPRAREMLTARMQRHGQEMMSLVVNLVILRHEETAVAAEEIAAEPRLSRPLPDERDTINALLPARFFDLEDELRERAQSVADAARSRDDARLIAAYGQLTETCVSCHTVYLRDPSSSDEGGD
jgi:hypothetical protein